MKLLSLATALLATLTTSHPVFDDLMTPSTPLDYKRAPAASLRQVSNFGSNPSNAKMYIYVPDNLAASPPIIVAIHYCTGTAQAYYTNSPYARLADQKGFIVIYPESPYSGTCWDVSSHATLTHNGGGNSNSIANMVEYTLKTYNGDATKVFVTGSSSGAMMTNVMAATYPALFAAGIVYSGVPAGCFYSQAGGTNAWNSSCANGQVHGTPQVWAKVVRDMYPGYDGARPKMEIYHGSADTTLNANNYNETIKQWAGVFGFDYQKPDTTQDNVPQGGYTTYTWGEGKLVGVYARGVGHSVPIRGSDDMKFFGL
ncbi:Alpha/Beta hydrolase protein [Neurospora crassa]|nr:Alpha/Beta hydrolase protein [Neurospora crassa]